MPLLRRYPARGLGRELERRPLDFAAGEDAVAAAQILVELARRHLLRPVVGELRLADGIDSKGAQRFFHVAVAVEVPVVAVVHQALRRDLARGLAVVLA